MPGRIIEIVRKQMRGESKSPVGERLHKGFMSVWLLPCQMVGRTRASIAEGEREYTQSGHQSDTLPDGWKDSGSSLPSVSVLAEPT
eukprot:582129-Pyramimonas_sp.AAC.1